MERLFFPPHVHTSYQCVCGCVGATLQLRRVTSSGGLLTLIETKVLNCLHFLESCNKGGQRNYSAYTGKDSGRSKG